MMYNSKKVASRTQLKYLSGPLPILLIAFYFFSIFTLANWWHAHRYSVTGDEPHYLVMADGVVSYGTFEQTKPYKKEFENKYIYPLGLAPSNAVPGPSNTHGIIGPHGLYNAHNIGLPLLISIPYKIGSDVSGFLPSIANYNIYGIGLVKLFLIILGGGGCWCLDYNGILLRKHKDSCIHGDCNNFCLSLHSSLKPNIS